MSEGPIAQLARALDAAGEVVAGVAPEEWPAPTPCLGWTVRDVANHLVGGNDLFARILAGEQLPAREELVAAGRTDRLGDDPLGAYRASARELLAAFRGEGVLEQTFSVPVGAVPGIAALHLRIVEALVHGWDIARATGRPVRFPEELAEAALEFTRRTLPAVPAAPPGKGPFGPPRPVADDAPAIDRLAALLGRTVTTAGT